MRSAGVRSSRDFATGRRAVVQVFEPKEDDAALVHRALDGDRWATEALYRRHAPRAFRTATVLLGDGPDVDDVVQDAFVKGFKSLKSLQEPAAFGGWFRRIVANLAKSKLRKRSFLRNLGLDRGLEEPELERLAAPHLSPEQRTELAKVGANLNKMSVEERMAWVLRRVEGWTLPEISQAMKISLATVKRRLSAADKRLKNYLEGGVS